MLFLIFGGGLRLKERGEGQRRMCGRCHNETVWRALRSYRELTLFFIPVLRWHRRDIEACPVCGQVTEATEATALGRPRIWSRNSPATT